MYLVTDLYQGRGFQCENRIRAESSQATWLEANTEKY